MSNSCVRIAILARSNFETAENILIGDWVRKSDRAEAARRANPEMAQRFLLGRSLVRALVDRIAPAAGRDCDISMKANGKPVVRLPSGAPGPAISVSHSGAMIVAAATSIGPLGIDVEYHRRIRSIDAIASFSFGPTEKEAANRSAGDFYRIWCLREAMSKASGKGLSEVTDQVDRVVGGPGLGAWKADIQMQPWLLAHISPAMDYSLAIAVRCSGPTTAVDWTEDSLDLWHLQPANG